MHRSLNLLLGTVLLAAFVPLVGCETTSITKNDKRGRVLTPSRMYTSINWSRAEREKDVAARSVRVTRSASYAFVRVRTAEKPHVHDNTDLLVTVLSGKVMMHLGMQHIEVGPGDVIEIPRGTVHWAENIGDQPAEAYMIATPPYNGEDMRLVDIPGK